MSSTQSHFDKDPLAPLPSQEHHSHHNYPGSEHTKDEGGVCEAYPGIIESSDIDPLHHERMKGNESAVSKVTGAAKYAYSAVVGDEAGKQAGKETVTGSSK